MTFCPYLLDQLLPWRREEEGGGEYLAQIADK